VVFSALPLFLAETSQKARIEEILIVFKYFYRQELPHKNFL